MCAELEKDGVLDVDYAHRRAKGKGAYSYRVGRRSYEVIEGMKRSGFFDNFRVLDIGTADGIMLRRVKAEMPTVECFGIEYSRDLLKLCPAEMHRACADGQYLPFADASFEVAVCTAVIEHLPEPVAMLKEAFRVLKKNGVIIITSPDPFWDGIANMLEKNEHHVEVFDIPSISRMMKEGGFTVEFTKKFMLSPVGMPCELPIEDFVAKIGLNFFFLNQLLIGRKE